VADREDHLSKMEILPREAVQELHELTSARETVRIIRINRDLEKSACQGKIVFSFTVSDLGLR